MNKCQLIANGDLPAKEHLDYLAGIGYRRIFCADGGANSASKLNLIPDYIIGDLDSVFPEVILKFINNSTIIKNRRQDDTDVEKALKYMIKLGFSEVVLLGATGDRLDHSFCNMGIVLKFFDRIKIYILHKTSVLAAFSGTIRMKTIPGETISVYGFDDKTKISSKGLKYPLKNISLPFGKKESTSNEALGREVTLDIRGGKIFVIREVENLVNNDFIFAD